MVIRRFLGVAVAALLIAGCDELAVTGVQTPVGNRADVVGIWTGVEEITTVEDIASNAGIGDAYDRGFSFPVALRLFADGRFELWASALTQETQRYGPCEGIYRRRGNTIEFFSASACRALPLARFTLGTRLPGGLTLEASTANTLTTGAANVRVRMTLER